MTVIKKVRRKDRLSGLKIGDTYQNYIKLVPKEKRVANKKEYKETVKKFLNYMADKLLYIGMLKLPAGLGVLQIMGSDLKISIDNKTGKIKGNVDWAETRKLWRECEECKKNKQLVFFTNDDTGFKIYKVYWFSKINRLVNKSVYKFTTCMSFRQKLYKKLKMGDYAYMYRLKKYKKK